MQLAQMINEKPQVINEYESGKAIPNPQASEQESDAEVCSSPLCKAAVTYPLVHIISHLISSHHRF